MEMVGTVPAANHVSLYCKIGKWGRGFHSRSCDSYGPWFRKDSIWIGSGLPIWQSLRPYKDTVGQAECREVWLFSYISPFLTASFILWFWVPFAILLRSWLIFQPSSENMKGQHVDDAVIRSSNWVGRRSLGHVAFWTASLVKEYSVLSMGFTTPIYRLSTLPMTGTLFPSSPLTFSFWDSLFSLSTNSGTSLPRHLWFPGMVVLLGTFLLVLLYGHMTSHLRTFREPLVVFLFQTSHPVLLVSF